MDFAFNKSVTKEPRRRDTFFEAYFLQLKAAELLSRSPPEYSLDNMTTDERETCADESDVYKKKKEEAFCCPSPSSPPQVGLQLKSVRCDAHSRCPQTTLKLCLTNRKTLLFSSSACADEGSKAGMLTHKKKEKKKKLGLMTRSSGIFTVLVRCECPSLDVLPN